MKKCLWNIHRPVWALLVILCCHGNFADDPLPSFTQLSDDLTQLQTQKTVPIAALTDSITKAEDFVHLATKELTRPDVSLPKDDSSILDEKRIPTDSLDQPDAGFDIGGESNTSALPAEVKKEDGDQLARGAKITDSYPETVAAPERRNPPFMEGVILEAPLIEPVKTTSSRTNAKSSAQVVADVRSDEEAQLPQVPSEGELGRSPQVAEGSPKTKEEAASAEPESRASDLNHEPVKEPNVAELKTGADNATPVQQQQRLESQTQYILDGSGTPVTEDMPSFSEWSKKRLEEQVKQGSNPPAAASQPNKAPPKQLRHKNYASVDCGAKVINANPEAQSTGAVLSHFRDDYMLNPCTAKIWLVIELCESIQAEGIDLANFELFSSSPRDFSVYSSDRYPTRDWTFLGSFKATDERTVQNFSFGHTSFGKYIKVEMVSHYGSEHFCPLSLVRVFGTSEYEALETEESADSAGRDLADEDDEAASAGEHLSSHESPNLFGSAKDAVMNIVKKVLRSDKDAGASVGGKVEQPSSYEDNSNKCSENCICLQRLPTADCEGEEEETAKKASAECPKSTAVTHLHCHYNELLSFLLSGWPGPFHGRLLEQCFSTCVPHIEECGSDPLGFLALGRASAPIHPTCRFYSAILGPVTFGALCNLDKLLLDEQGRLPVAAPRCPVANRTSNLSDLGVDPIHIPNATPTVLFETVSSHAGIHKLVADGGEYQCDSFDHMAVCSTKLESTDMGASPPGLGSRRSDSESVIHTGAIKTEKTPSDESQAASSSSSFQSQILPTRTLPGDAKSPMKSKVVVDAKAQSILGSEFRESVSKEEVPSRGAAKDRSKETPPATSSDLGGGSTTSASKVVPPSKETKSPSSDSQSQEAATSTLDVKPVDAKVPKEKAQAASVVKEQPVDRNTAAPPPPPPDAKEIPESTSQQGAELDAEAAVLDQEHSGAYDEGAASSVSAPSPPNGFTTDGVAGGSNGRPLNNGGLNGAGFVAPGQKESVFVRLSNRIKALELNMSLSSQYLEELSRRYRKQMEEMQKAFNKTIGALNETARSAYERDVKQQEVIMKLQSQLDGMYELVLNLREEQDSIHVTVVARHILLMVVEACVMSALFFGCVRSSQKQGPRSGRAVSVVRPNTSATAKGAPPSCSDGRKKRSSSLEDGQRRRNSDSGSVGRHCDTMKDRRRPSTEALNVSGSYSDLMIAEPMVPGWPVGPPLKEQDQQSRKKKKHKNKQQGKQELYRSVSNNVLLYNSNCQKPPLPVSQRNNPPSRKTSATGISSAGLLFAAVGKPAASSRVQELTRKDKKPGETTQQNYGSAQYTFTNLFSGYYGGCPPPEFPAKLPLHPHNQQNGGLKKPAVEKVC